MFLDHYICHLVGFDLNKESIAIDGIVQKGG